MTTHLASRDGFDKPGDGLVVQIPSVVEATRTPVSTRTSVLSSN